MIVFVFLFWSQPLCFFGFFSQSHRHTQAEPVSLSLADTGTELVVPPSTVPSAVPQTVSAVCESSTEELAQLCKEIKTEFGCSDCFKDEDAPEDEYVGKLFNIKVYEFSAVCVQTQLADEKLVSLLLSTCKVVCVLTLAKKKAFTCLL